MEFKPLEILPEALKSLQWLNGRWFSANGRGIYPTINDFQYHETLEFICIGLWTMLAPYSEKISLYEVSGQTLAVDAAGWICDTQQMRGPPKMYLRNLFFRCRGLVLNDIRPILVLDGVAPELKRTELERRQATAPSLSRPRFKAMLTECERLARCAGVSCVRSPEEAEAACASLNVHGLVDGVITQDSDCLAYGALRVYRNLKISQTSHMVSYDADQIIEKTGLTKDRLIALSVLCGCDYGDGAAGSALRTAARFLRALPSDVDVMKRLSNWKDPQHKDSFPGEAWLRKRVLASNKEFPPRDVINEFLQATETCPDLPATSPQPDLLAFIRIMERALNWTERYCVSVFLPLLTRWQLTEPAGAPCTLPPLRVIKVRRPRGIACFLIQWDVANSPYDGLIPDEQLREGEKVEDLWVTSEHQDAVKRRFPDMLLPAGSKKATLVVRRKKVATRRSLSRTLTDSNLDLSLLVEKMVSRKCERVERLRSRPVRLIFGPERRLRNSGTPRTLS